jgi:hypothetical protein
MLSAGCIAWDHSIGMSLPRAYRAGESVEDYCRACKVDRMHTVIVVDQRGRPLRVTCDYCESQHNFRGGPRVDVPRPSAAMESAIAAPPSSAPRAVTRTVTRAAATSEPFPLATERERSAPPVTLPDQRVDDFELLLRRIIREEAGVSLVAPAAKWRGGTLVLRPGTPGLQEKSWPIETFFHKVVMLRNRLRTLEQQVNASDLPDDVKVKLQGYVSGCYGSLTSFNLLFADEEDQFKGSSAD